jgi:very-short-patch-repair endonuclease
MNSIHSYCTANPFTYKLLKDFALSNRKHPTQAESLLWEAVRGKQMGQPFRRQHIIGEFIADFVCLPTKLIIELDGRYHSLPEQQISDEQRTQWLQHQGYKVVRFTNEQVFHDLENTIKNIKELIYETKQ